MSRGKRRLEEDTSYNPSVSQSTYASGSKLLAALDCRTAKGVEKPKAKRVRKTKDLDAPLPEKRGAIFKKTCPKNILDRVDRVITQRFFMIDRRREGHELREEFSVLGSTGNVYTVTIGRRPSCSCPDATKGNHCKHILFIFLKVLQVPQHSTHWYQKALLASELEEIFRDAPPAPNALANAQIRDAFERATGRASSSQASSSAGEVNKSRRVPGEEDDCPICYEGMHGASINTLTWCETCGNALHTECFQQWARSKGTNVTCVFCRAGWVIASGKASTSKEGYLNLSGVAGLSPVRDTSSYYHGPRRGERYFGNQDYD